MKVAVVGGGIDGASAARHLAERGHQTVVFERFPFGHTQGSSHGNSRIVRSAYPDAHYTEIMLDAYPMWSELQAASGTQLLHEPGLLYFGSESSEKMISVAVVLKSLGVKYELLSYKASKRVFPQLHLESDEVGIWTPEAGWVDAAKAVKATLGLAEAAGAELRSNTRADKERLEQEFDAYVVCPGAWIREWVDAPVKVTLQTYGYLHGAMRGPVWIEASDDAPYGFPSEGPKGFKLGIHAQGPVIDPTDAERVPSAEAVHKIVRTARKRFGIKSPRLENAAGCLYTSTANEDFLLGRLGDKGFYASACSGHGFKFGPWIGKILADFVECKDEPENHPRFFSAARGI